jgi:hypothetical protein
MSPTLLAWAGSLLGAALFSAGGYFVGVGKRLEAAPPSAAGRDEADGEGRERAEAKTSGADGEVDALRKRVRELDEERAALGAEREQLAKTVADLKETIVLGERARVSMAPATRAKGAKSEPADVEAMRAELSELRAQTALLRRRAATASVPPRATDTTGDRSIQDTAEKLLRARLEEATAARERAEADLREAHGSIKTLTGKLAVAGGPSPSQPPAAELPSPPKAADREALLAWLRGLMDARVAASFVVLDDDDAVVAGTGTEADALAKWGQAVRAVGHMLEAPMPQLGAYLELAVRGERQRRAMSWAFPALGVVACIVTKSRAQ